MCFADLQFMERNENADRENNAPAQRRMSLYLEGENMVVRYLAFFVLLTAALCFGACEEIHTVLAYRTPIFIEGTPEALPVDAKTVISAAILTNSGWVPMQPYSELPEKFAVQTGIKDRVQVIMEHRGVLDVYPGSLVVINDCTLSNVTVLQGKCAFMPLVKPLADAYNALKTDAERVEFIRQIKRRYLEEKNNLFFVKNPFVIETTFSSQAAPKGKSFSIIVDSNHVLDFGDFKLDKLKPSFALIRSNAASGEGYRYMAVTGLDIYENADKLHFTAAAKDVAGNWVKMRTYIPTEAWRASLLNGTSVNAGTQPVSEQSDIFVRRYRERLNLKMQNPAFKRSYLASLEQQNRQIGFYWKSQQVLRQSALIASKERDFTRIFATVSPVKYWNGNFAVPATGVITSGFGHYRWYYGGFSSVHRAIDIANVVGTSIHAPNAGKVVYVGNTPDRGNNIVIDHGLGVYTCLFHLAEMFVENGDVVRKGDVVASLGNTGLSSGPHVHWEMVVNGRRVNPLDWTSRKY